MDNLASASCASANRCARLHLATLWNCVAHLVIFSVARRLADAAERQIKQSRDWRQFEPVAQSGRERARDLGVHAAAVACAHRDVLRAQHRTALARMHDRLGLVYSSGREDEIAQCLVAHGVQGVPSAPRLDDPALPRGAQLQQRAAQAQLIAALAQAEVAARGAQAVRVQEHLDLRQHAGRQWRKQA